MQISLFRCGALCLVFSSGLTLAQSDRMEDGRRAYESYCKQCHESDETSAPTTRQESDWAARSKLWEAVLFEHAEKGYLEMPAKGGVEGMSEYEVEAAAEYMVTVTHPDMLHD